MTHSIEFKKQVVETMQRYGYSAYETARIFKVAHSAVLRWSKGIHLKEDKRILVTCSELKENLEKFPNMTTKERALYFKVSPAIISKSKNRLKKLETEKLNIIGNPIFSELCDRYRELKHLNSFIEGLEMKKRQIKQKIEQLKNENKNTGKISRTLPGRG